MDTIYNSVIGEVYSDTADVALIHNTGASVIRNYFRITKDGQGTNIKSWHHPLGGNVYDVIPLLTEELAMGGWDMDCKIIDDAVNEYTKEMNNKNKSPL
jgi:hypothetical protein